MGQITFENYDRRIGQILAFLKENGISSLEEAEQICRDAGLDVAGTVRGIQPICFQDAPWGYVVGAAAALKRGDPSPAAVATTLGEGLQSFCLAGSVSAQRKIGLGHGKLAVKNLVGIVFYPAWFGVNLGELLLGYPHNVATMVKENGSGAGRSLVESKNITLHHKYHSAKPLLSAGDIALPPWVRVVHEGRASKRPFLSLPGFFRILQDARKKPRA